MMNILTGCCLVLRNLKLTTNPDFRTLTATLLYNFSVHATKVYTYITALPLAEGWSLEYASGTAYNQTVMVIYFFQQL